MSISLIYNFVSFRVHLWLRRPVFCTAHQEGCKKSKIRSTQTGALRLLNVLDRRQNTRSFGFNYMAVRGGGGGI